MKKDKEPDKKDNQEQCPCGATLDISPEDLSPDTEVCPECGAATKPDISELSCADTQTLNIAEMARMAQEGVDPTSVSGEWVTVLDPEPKKKKKKIK